MALKVFYNALMTHKIEAGKTDSKSKNNGEYHTELNFRIAEN